MDIGKKISELLDKKNITKTDFAKLIDYDRTHIYNLLAKRSIDLTLLSKICKVLDVSIYEFIDNDTRKMLGVSEPRVKYNKIDISGENNIVEDNVQQIGAGSMELQVKLRILEAENKNLKDQVKSLRLTVSSLEKAITLLDKQQGK